MNTISVGTTAGLLENRSAYLDIRVDDGLEVTTLHVALETKGVTHPRHLAVAPPVLFHNLCGGGVRSVSRRARQLGRLIPTCADNR